MKEEFRNTQVTSYPPPGIDSDYVEQLLQKGLTEIENRIVENSKHPNPKIREYAEYVLKSGGKRIRSKFILLSFLLFNDIYNDEVLDIATAAEMLHTASLLHDDVVDEADLRRGRETINHRWGNKTAVIMGDFLLARSFKLLLKADSIRIIRIFTDTALELGNGALIEQVYKDDLNTTEEIYFQIISNKTAAFFRTCLSIGGILSKSTETEIESLEKFGFNYGIAFQITDDIIDLVSDERKMGKPRGKDIQEGHLTLPLIRYFAEDNQRVPRVRLSELTPDDPEFFELIDGINNDGSIDYSFTKAREYIEKALHELRVFEGKPCEPLLRKMVIDLINRKS